MLKRFPFGEGDHSGQLEISRDKKGRIWACVSIPSPAIVTIKLSYSFGPYYEVVYDKFHGRVASKLLREEKRFPEEAWKAIEAELAEIQITTTPAVQN